MNYTPAQIDEMLAAGKITPLMAASARLRHTVSLLTELGDDIHAGIEHQRELDRHDLRRNAEHRDATNRKGRE